MADNISETKQDRDIVAMEDWWEIICTLLNGANTRSLLLFEYSMY